MRHPGVAVWMPTLAAQTSSRYRCRSGISLTSAAARRSDVPPFMVMDVMAAAARIEAAGGHVIHMEVGQPAASGAENRDRGRARRARRRADRLHLRARALPRCARASRGITARSIGCAVDAERIVVTTGSSGAFILAFLAHVRAGRSRRGHGARLSAVPPYPDRARLRAGADRDLQRNPSCADRRSLAGGPSRHAAEGRAGRQSRQSRPAP